MRNVKIKAIRSETVKIPLEAAKAINATFRNFEERQLYYQTHASGALFPADLELPSESVVPLHKVVLEIEGARPEGNFSDIWVDGEQLLGVILDEENQLIKGYLSTVPSEAPSVQVELPDGTKINFQLD